MKSDNAEAERSDKSESEGVEEDAQLEDADSDSSPPTRSLKPMDMRKQLALALVLNARQRPPFSPWRYTKVSS